MAGYCVPQAGINIGPASLGERELRSVYLVPHEAAVKEAHVWSVMPSYNAIDGIPARLFFLLIAPTVTQHLGILARLSRVLRDPKLRQSLLAAEQPEQVIALIREAEEKL